MSRPTRRASVPGVAAGICSSPSRPWAAERASADCSILPLPRHLAAGEGRRWNGDDLRSAFCCQPEVTAGVGIRKVHPASGPLLRNGRSDGVSEGTAVPPGSGHSRRERLGVQLGDKLVDAFEERRHTCSRKVLINVAPAHVHRGRDLGVVRTPSRDTKPGTRRQHRRLRSSRATIRERPDDVKRGHPPEVVAGSVRSGLVSDSLASDISIEEVA